MAEYIHKKIGSILFSLLSPTMIRKMATAKIVTPELYDKEGYPVDGGLMDIRLGVIDPGLRCKSCNGKLKECTGHFGYIELARPVMHIKYVKHVLDFLKGTCRECNRILIDEPTIEKYKAIIEKKGLEKSRKKLKELIKKIRIIKKCPHCKAKQDTIKLEKPLNFYEKDRRLSPIEIHKRLEKISDDDALFFGINPATAKPEWMVLTILPIPPVTMRPSITLESGERSEDDLTHKLGDIVRINQRLFENINAGAPEIIVEDLWDLLQYHVTTYFDNTISQIPPARHRSGQPLKTITERIKSKEGRFRHNLAGKRVNFSARTVISPDPKIQLNEVGVPIEVAFELTVPERVTDWNIKYLKEFIKKGPKAYPGANYVIRPDGAKKKITDDVKDALLEELAPGFIVERHLMNGDITIFNRQPSLHRMSIMCHKAKIIPGKSFRLNPAVCNPYNADFDGDEMNLHVPQTEEARAEAEILMEVQKQIMTPKNGENVIGCKQDAITGNYLLTRDLELPKEEAIQLLASIGLKDLSKLTKLKARVSGKEIFSAVLPEDLDFIGFAKRCRTCDRCYRDTCKHGAYVLIKKGQLLSGIIDEKIIGEGGGSLIRELHRLYEPQQTLETLGLIFRLGIATLLKRGFTIGLSDIDVPEKLVTEIQDQLIATEKKIKALINQADSGNLEALPGKTVDETLEANILKQLNNVRNKIGEIIADSLDPDNANNIVVTSGARGSILNITQMSGCVGQQALRGKRVELGYKDRTLSLFKEHDKMPEAHGFVEKGFKAGLKPAEFFFHAMTGRDSLMDTALRTPKSGYLYRRLTNALQDLKVEYDHTVRDANRTIVQFQYGEDSLDVSKTEKGIIDVAKMITDVISK